MTKTDPIREARLNQRLDQIHQRLEKIAGLEAQAALVNGYGAMGEFDPERQRLVDETDAILDAMSAIGASPKFCPA